MIQHGAAADPQRTQTLPEALGPEGGMGPSSCVLYFSLCANKSESSIMKEKNNAGIGNVAWSVTKVIQRATRAGICKDTAVEGRNSPALWLLPG